VRGVLGSTAGLVALDGEGDQPQHALNEVGGQEPPVLGHHLPLGLQDLALGMRQDYPKFSLKAFALA
jgi:hypothetical protein